MTMPPLSRLDRFWQLTPAYFAVLTVLAAATPLAFAPYYHFWLMPLLFGGFIRLGELKPKRRVLSAYWFGLVGYAVQFWWIHTSMHDVAGMPNRFAVPLTLLLPAFLALFPAIALWLFEKYRLPRWAGIGLALPVLWTLTEFARERVLTGFGWGALGYSQIADHSPLAGYAPLGGIHLVTLAAALLSGWLVLILHNRNLRQRILFAAAATSLLTGGWLLRQTAFTRPVGTPVSVALVQGNIEQRFKFSAEHYIATYQRYYELVSHTRAQIVILPETAFPQFLQQLEPGLIEQFADVAERNGSALVLGIPMFAEDGTNYLNAMINLAGYRPEQPETLQSYAKNHLVPFGEFRPLPTLTNPLYKYMDMPLADFRRGGTGQPPFDMAGQKVAFNICYEDGFGDELIPSAKQATLLANASNLAWFGRSNAMWQQLQQSQARALELGRPMLRATNNGATAIVSAQGRVLKRTAPDSVSVLEGEVQGMSGETPYMRMGSSWPLISVLLAAAALLLCIRRNKQPETAASPQTEPETPVTDSPNNQSSLNNQSSPKPKKHRPPAKHKSRKSRKRR